MVFPMNSFAEGEDKEILTAQSELLNTSQGSEQSISTTEEEKFAVTVNVRKYGARNKKDSTKAFQKALDVAANKGSSKKKGRVIVPAGTYYITGTLLIRSNVYIKCDKKAKIIKKKSDFAYIPVSYTHLMWKVSSHH